MESDLGNDLDAAILGEAVFPIEKYNHTNFSMLMIPRRDPLYIVIPMTIVYSLIFITGVIGNVITFIVIIRNKYMHTATNYYLFSLAISDLLLLVSGLPQEMVSIWCRYPYLFGEVFCVLRGLSAETSTNASVLTITAFTVERYVAICHPFLSQTMSKLSRAIKLIVVIWFVALSFALPQAIQFGVITIDNDPDQAMCTLKRTIIDHSFVLSSFLFFVTPMTVITVLYILIGIKLRKSSMMKKNRSSFHDNGENRSSQRGKYYPTHQQSSKRVVKMLVAVVVAFFICWAPFHAQRLVYTYGSNKNKPKGAVMKLIYEIITYVSGILYYVSTTINPILYHIMSFKFREAFKDTLTRCTCMQKGKGRRGKRTYFILNRYYQRGTLSRRGTQSYDIDNSSNFVRDDSLRSSGVGYDMTLSKYKYRKKTVSVSEATDDSTRTEMTQISQKADSPNRGPSQKQFAAVVVQIGKLEFQPDSTGHHGKFWQRSQRPSEKFNRFWHVFTCIRSGYPKSQIRTEYCVRLPHFCERKSNGNPILGPNGNPAISENLPMYHMSNQETTKEASSNNISNSSLKDCNCEDLHEELAANMPMLVGSDDKDQDEQHKK